MVENIPMIGTYDRIFNLPTKLVGTFTVVLKPVTLNNSPKVKFKQENTSIRIMALTKEH